MSRLITPPQAVQITQDGFQVAMTEGPNARDDLIHAARWAIARLHDELDALEYPAHETGGKAQ